ncbi:hypothetical protein PGIGA_G00059220 [Pangasianodon gigas]|uniref:Uncharacterized protein n=1 Tax=Pangasianodon gigas TaxID=30993 RepID=A0ACC5X5F5_PANGG|nr:hypothetical protein [Pangasianodon gigas]
MLRGNPSDDAGPAVMRSDEKWRFLLTQISADGTSEHQIQGQKNPTNVRVLTSTGYALAFVRIEALGITGLISNTEHKGSVEPMLVPYGRRGRANSTFTARMVFKARVRNELGISERL